MDTSLTDTTLGLACLGLACLCAAPLALRRRHRRRAPSTTAGALLAVPESVAAVADLLSDPSYAAVSLALCLGFVWAAREVGRG